VVPTVRGIGGMGSDDRDRCLSGGKATFYTRIVGASPLKVALTITGLVEGEQLSGLALATDERISAPVTLGHLALIDHLGGPRGCFRIKPNPIRGPAAFSESK